MYSGKPTFAVIGDVTLKESTSIYRKRVAITEWISHPNYAPPKIYDDIAVRQLHKQPFHVIHAKFMHVNFV
jgi:hypothetical protein